MRDGLNPYFIATMLDHYTDRLDSAKTPQERLFVRQQQQHYTTLIKQTNFSTKLKHAPCERKETCLPLAN